MCARLFSDHGIVSRFQQGVQFERLLWKRAWITHDRQTVLGSGPGYVVLYADEFSHLHPTDDIYDGQGAQEAVEKARPVDLVGDLALHVARQHEAPDANAGVLETTEQLLVEYIVPVVVVIYGSQNNYTVQYRSMRFIRRISFLVFSGIPIGYIILLPPEIVFL